MPRWAFVDESIRVEDGRYILAAVTVDEAEPLRENMRNLAKTWKVARVHWRKLRTDSEREQAVKTIAGLDVTGLVVVGTAMKPSHQERARRRCIETLLPSLERDFEVESVVFEARTPSLNQKDRSHLIALRGKRWIGRDLRVDTHKPLEDPALWAADILAGAANYDADGDPRFWSELESVAIRQFVEAD